MCSGPSGWEVWRSLSEISRKTSTRPAAWPLSGEASQAFSWARGRAVRFTDWWRLRADHSGSAVERTEPARPDEASGPEALGPLHAALQVPGRTRKRDRRYR